jgi:transcriptional regulator with XRE-family HTH domain
MSRLLADRLRVLRGAAGLSQAQMGKLLGMSQSAYQRVEAGDTRHHTPTLDRIDAAMIDAGFDWHPGLAAELEAGALATELLIRLDRIEHRLDELVAGLSRLDASRDLMRRLRQLVNDAHHGNA